MNTDKQDIIRVTIPVPSHIPLRRGKNALDGFDSVFHVRWKRADIEVVNEAALLCGVDTTAFIRQCTLFAAAAILEHHNGKRPNITVG